MPNDVTAADLEGAAAVPAPPPAVIVPGPELLLRGRVLPTFAQWAVTGEDNLRVRVYCSKAGVVVSVHGRFLDAQSGNILPFAFDCPTDNGRAGTITLHKLGLGYILNLTAFAGAGDPAFGECYVIVEFIRGLEGAVYLLGTLLAGYVTALQGLGWPGSAISNSFEGQGFLTIAHALPRPAAQDIFVEVPAGARWEFLSGQVVCRLQSAGVTRYIEGRVETAGIVFGFSPCQVPVGEWFDYSVALMQGPGWPGYIQRGRIVLAVPVNFRLAAGSRLYLHLENNQANDWWMDLYVGVREWLDVV